MATVLVSPGRYSGLDIPTAQATASTAVGLLSSNTDAVAKTLLVTQGVTSSDVLAIVPTALTRNQVLDQLRQIEMMMNQVTWPPS